MSGSRGPRESREAGYQLGDLDLPVSPRRPPPPQRAAPGYPPAPAPANHQGHLPGSPAGAPPAASGARLGRATSVDLENDGPGDLMLELDVGPPGGAVPAAPALDFGFGERDLGLEAPTGPEPALEVELAAAPRGGEARAPDAAPGPVTSLVHVADEEQAARELADFGATPTHALGSLPYALRVAQRLIVLHGARKQLAQAETHREAELHQAWVGMGQALMNLAADKRLESLRSQVAAVNDAQTHVSRAGQTVAQTRAQNQEALSALEREAEQLNRELAPFQEAAQAAEQAHKKAQENLRRAQGLQKRVELELRALAEANKLDPSRTLELNTQIEQRKAQVLASSEDLAQAEEELGQARRELALHSGGIASLEGRKKRLLGQIRAAEAAVEQQAKAAEGSHATALRALAEAARTQRLESLVAAQESQVAAAETALADAQRQLARQEQAMRSYDRSTVRRGVILMVVLIAALFVALKLN